MKPDRKYSILMQKSNSYEHNLKYKFLMTKTVNCEKSNNLFMNEESFIEHLVTVMANKTENNEI